VSGSVGTDSQSVAGPDTVILPEQPPICRLLQRADHPVGRAGAGECRARAGRRCRARRGRGEPAGGQRLV